MPSTSRLSTSQRVMDVPVQLTAEIGRTRITIKNLLQLSQGSVVELDGLAGQPLDVLINGYLIAQGEVVVVNDKYGIRLTDIITPSERMQTNAALLPLALECGWSAARLGPTLPDGDDEITAVVASITPEGLRAVRGRLGISGPVTRFPLPAVKIAA